MNPRVILIIVALAFIGLLLVLGARAFARWLKIHYPRRASAILVGLWIVGIAAGWLMAREIRDQPTFQSNDLITLREPVVARTISADRESRVQSCVVDVHEHLGVLEVDSESGTLKARVESNNTSAPIYCPIGAEVRVETAWLHRPTVTRRG
ncbi:MAG: exported protein of unknown function [Nitrospira sp.]|jgi:hypothetical protein|nr:exported protein of unknown function [Nitrospira sp.]